MNCEFKNQSQTMKTISFVILFFCVGVCAPAQQILLDKPVRAGELILFPELSNENNYYYVPDKPRLALHPDGKPQLSFLRYAKNEKTAATENTAITESTTGGGIVHALVELSVTDQMIKDAERALGRLKSNAKIVGPVVFKSGTVSLISATIKGGEKVAQVVGLGNAPILENQRSAVAVQLNPLGSKILWETFNTPTPDFTFNFEMEVTGYLSPKRVIIEADFERIYKHQGIQAAAAAPVLAAEIKASFDDLFDTGAIKVTQIGEDAELSKLKETAYQQLITLIFDRVGGTGVPQLNQLYGSNQKSMLDRATENLANARKETREENQRIDRLRAEQAQREAQVRTATSGRARANRTSGGHEAIQPPTEDQRRGTSGHEGGAEGIDIPQREPMPSLSIAVSYELKQERRKGTYKIDLNKYTETSRSMPFAFNPGNVKGSCESCFLEVNIDDPLMKQREITATLGGTNSADFASYINFVNVILRKKHQNGQETVDEVKIDKSKFNTTGNFFKMLYGWKGDDDRAKWLEYEYQTMWSFNGGNQVVSGWQQSEFGSIALEPPILKKPIYIECDQEFVQNENIRAIEIKFYSKMGEKEETQTVSLKTSKDELTRTIDLLLPKDVENYDYEITYFVKGKDPFTSKKKPSNYGRIDLDRFL
jgi:hypothetical protein